jgi:hypothetical protein
MLGPVHPEAAKVTDDALDPQQRVRLVLGPLLRYVGQTRATVWVETNAATEVEILGHRVRTFQVLGHHYALVVLDGLQPTSTTPYDVRLDGQVVWPLPDDRPPPVIRTREGERGCRLVFGSCRVAGPATALTPSEDPSGLGIDALWAYSKQLQSGRAEWPDGLVLLGDQVYVDDVSPQTAAFIRARRDVTEPPGEDIADFEEYTQLYRESWSDPDIRWLLSTVPSTMIFDDHEVSDDWNISLSWIEDTRALPWWDDRITAAFMAYWLYQHLGNLAPPELAEETMFATVYREDDAGPRLREFARACDRESAASRWAYHRDFGRSRLLVIDSRAARVLVDGQRQMIDAEEWDWIVHHAQGSFDHLIVATTLPVFAPHGIHHLEAWNEAVCDGRWGSIAAWLGERMRRGCDLEHWAAFHDSFEQLIELLRDVSAGRQGNPPSTITILSGDVHTTYVAEVDLGRGAGPSRVYQVVCSPFRNPMSTFRHRVVNAAGSRQAAAFFSLLARASRVPRLTTAWTYLARRTYDNSIGELVLDHGDADVTLRRSTPAGESGDWLELVETDRLSGESRRA